MWVSWGSMFGCDKCILYWRHYGDWSSIKRLQRAPCQPTPASPYQSEINTKLWKKGDYPKGPVDVLRRRLFHRNDNFVPPAQWTPTCVKTDFRRKTGCRVQPDDSKAVKQRKFWWHRSRQFAFSRQWRKLCTKQKNNVTQNQKNKKSALRTSVLR